LSADIYAEWRGNFTVNVNGLTANTQLSGRLSSDDGTKLVFTWTGTIPQSLSPRIPKSVTFTASTDSRILSYVEGGFGVYSPFWIDPAVEVGDTVEIGKTEAPYVFTVEDKTASYDVLGQSLKSIVLTINKLDTETDYTQTLTATTYFDRATGFVLGGKVNYRWESLKAGFSFYITVSGEASLTNTNLLIGKGESQWSMWIPIVVFVVLMMAAVIYIIRRPRNP